MVMYEKGYCGYGHYKDNRNGLHVQDSCLEACLADVRCTYVAFKSGANCAMYRERPCDIRNPTSGYTTFQKIATGQYTQGIS